MSKIASGQQVTRPATKKEREDFIRRMHQKAHLEEAKLRMLSMKDKAEDRQKLADNIQIFEEDVQKRAEAMTVTEWQTVTRDATQEEMAQFAKDKLEGERAREQAEADAAERQAKLDALAGQLGLSKADLIDALRAAQEIQ